MDDVTVACRARRPALAGVERPRTSPGHRWVTAALFLGFLAVVAAAVPVLASHHPARDRGCRLGRTSCLAPARRPVGPLRRRAERRPAPARDRLHPWPGGAPRRSVRGQLPLERRRW